MQLEHGRREHCWYPSPGNDWLQSVWISDSAITSCVYKCAINPIINPNSVCKIVTILQTKFWIVLISIIVSISQEWTPQLCTWGILWPSACFPGTGLYRPWTRTSSYSSSPCGVQRSGYWCPSGFIISNSSCRCSNTWRHDKKGTEVAHEQGTSK
jgi:hypothetical protein